MEVRLLKKSCLNTEEFYKDFLDGSIKYKDEYFTEDKVLINNAPDFPIYMGKGSEEVKNKLFHEAFDVVSRYYLDTDRDVHFNEMFWYSLFCVHKRDYLLKMYPEIANGIKNFKNIVVKDFDWENYIYKVIIGAQYINDNVEDENERLKYYQLILDNLDLYNYIIKYEIFRNDKFFMNILDIIEEHDLTKVMKSQIKGRDDLGKDERVGRRVMFEFNKSYPVIMFPMLDKSELEPIFFEYLSYYYDINTLDFVMA